MSAGQSPTGPDRDPSPVTPRPNLDAIEARAEAAAATWDGTPARDLAREDVPALVAYARTLETEVEDLKGERNGWADTANTHMGMLRSARRRAEAAEAELAQVRDTLTRRSAAHDRLATRLDQVRALAREAAEEPIFVENWYGVPADVPLVDVADLLRVLDGDQGQP